LRHFCEAVEKAEQNNGLYCLWKHELSIGIQESTGIVISDHVIHIACLILAANEHIKESDLKHKSMVITDSGMVFINTIGYERRNEITKLDFMIKSQQLKLSQIEIFVKKRTFWIAIASIILSIINIFINLIN
jgi:hypothetical protein